MILHLQAAGVPTSWSIVAIYRSYYGVAHHSARAWMEHEEADRQNRPMRTRVPHEKPTPHLVIEIEKDCDAWSLKRHDLMMSERYLRRQEHDERTELVQQQSSPFPLEDGLAAFVNDTVRTILIGFGYLIPRAEWAERYPGQRIIADHFKAFFAADRAHRASGAEGDMPFELRWGQFMEAPDGFVWPFDVRADGDGWIVMRDGEPFGSLRSTDRDEAETMMRLLNGGYLPEDLPALLEDRPS